MCTEEGSIIGKVISLCYGIMNYYWVPSNNALNPS